jgi:WD40 repeat protein
MFILGKHEGGLNTNCLAYSPDGRLLASGKGGVRLWDLARREQMREVECPLGTSAVTFGPDGALVISGGAVVRLIDPATGDDQRNFQHEWCTAQCSLFADGGKTLVSGGHRHGAAGVKVGQVVRWNLENGRPRRKLPNFAEDVGFAALSPDGRTLVCGGEQNSGWLCDLKTRKVRATWECKPTGWRVVAFAPDGRYLAITAGKSVEVWDPRTLKRRRLLRGHEGTIHGVAFTRDGRLLTGSADGTVRLWSIVTGKQLAALDWEIGPINNICIAPDGETAAAGSAAGDLVVWDLDAL